MGGDEGQQVVQVVGVGRLANQDVEAASQLFGSFCHRCTFMFTADAGGDIGVKLLVTQGRCVPIAGATGKGSQFGQHILITVEHAREVHHFG